MKKYSVLVERVEYTPLFRTFEADTQEEAEALAQAAIDAQDPEAGREGWVEGDKSVEFQLEPTATTEVL